MLELNGVHDIDIKPLNGQSLPVSRRYLSHFNVVQNLLTKCDRNYPWEEDIYICANDVNQPLRSI